MTSSEHAIALAAERYRKQGRADIRKTDARSIVRAGRQIWTGKGDTDFVGDHQGRAWRLEVKETHEVSFPLASFSDHQRATMEKAAQRGCEVRLVLFFLPAWEAYSIPWPPLASFLALPWRQSITIAMCRAWGELVPIEATLKAGRVRAMFLDGAPHPEKEKAVAAVEAERFAHPLELPIEKSQKPTGLTERVDPFGAEAFQRAKRKARGGR